MLEYEYRKSQLEFLVIPKNNKKHWINKNKSTHG